MTITPQSYMTMNIIQRLMSLILLGRTGKARESPRRIDTDKSQWVVGLVMKNTTVKVTLRILQNVKASNSKIRKLNICRKSIMGRTIRARKRRLVAVRHQGGTLFHPLIPAASLLQATFYKITSR